MMRRLLTAGAVFACALMAEAQMSRRAFLTHSAVTSLSEEQREKWQAGIRYDDLVRDVQEAEARMKQSELPENVLATLPKDEREFYDGELKPLVSDWESKKRAADGFFAKMTPEECEGYAAYKAYREDYARKASERAEKESRMRSHLNELRSGGRPRPLLGGLRRNVTALAEPPDELKPAEIIGRLEASSNRLAKANEEIAFFESIKEKAAALSPEAKRLYDEDLRQTKETALACSAEIEKLKAKLTPEALAAYRREQEEKEAKRKREDQAQAEYGALLQASGQTPVAAEIRQRGRERAEQRQQLLAIQEELKRVRAANAAKSRSAGVASQLAVRREVETQRPLEPNESRLNCPRFAGYALGDVITNGVCVSRYRRFDHGEWESSTASWTLNVTEPVLGFSGEAKVGTDANGVIQSVYLRENVRVDPQTEDVRAKLIELILRHQEIVLREGGFDKSLYGTNSFDSIDLHGSSAYDLHQHLGFADARAEIYGCYRKGGPWGNEMLTCELRLNAPRKCQAPSAGKAKRSYSLPKDKYAEIGTLEGYSLGEKYDLAAHDGKRRFNLNKPVFGCGRLRLGLSKKNRIWEIGFEDSGHVPAGDAYESLTEVFLRYQKEVIAHYGYPEELLGKDNTYFVEDFETKRGSSRYYITQWLSFKKGSFQITLNAYDSRKGDGIDWNMSVRAVDFKVSREDDE